MENFTNFLGGNRGRTLRLLLVLVGMVWGVGAWGQTTLYSEDFSNDWKVGAITYGGISPAQPADGNWSWTSVGSPDNDGGSASSWDDMAYMDGAAVMSSSGSNSSTLAFRWNDVNDGSISNRVDWYSKNISGAYMSVTASLDYAIGNGSSSNSVWVYYQIDGGSWTLFGSSVNQTSASGTFTSTSLSCSSSIKLKVEALTRNSNTAYVTIDNVQITGSIVAPTITTSVSSLSNFSACSGSNSASQNFTVSGTNLTNDIVLTPPSGYEISLSSGSGYTTSTLTLSQSGGTVASTTIYARTTTAASGSPSGNISCTSTGATQKDVATGSATVSSPPSISSHPSTSAQSTCINGTAFTALSVTASGTGLSYQWYSNASNSNTGGTSISGATSSSYTPVNTSAGTLYYYCVVSGTSPCSAATSNVSGLFTVNALPTISGTTSVSIGSTTTLSGSATAHASTPWSSASTGVATVSSGGVVTGVAAGTSVITYMNTNGCTNTATVTVVSTYYSKSATADPTTLSNWNSNRDGSSGIAPSSFTAAGQTFVIQSGHTYKPTTTWTGSSTSTITVETGGALDLNAQSLSTWNNINIAGTGASSSGVILNSSSTPSTCTIPITLTAASTIKSTSGAITLSGTINLSSYNLTNECTNAITLSGVISGSGAVKKANVSSALAALTLSGDNTFTGGVDWSTGTQRGTININHANALGTGTFTITGAACPCTAGNDENKIDNTSGSLLTVPNPVTISGDFTFTGTTSLSFSGNVSISTTGKTFNIVNNTLTFSGVVSGGISYTKSGAGKLILSGNNTYTGTVTVSAGVLNIQHANALGTIGNGTTVASGAALQLEGAAVGAEALSLSGTGISTDGALRFISGTNSWAGLITLGAATRINADGGTNSIDVASGNAITGTHNLTFGGAGNLTVADPIVTSTGTLTKDGSGTLTLSGVNTYTGSTTVSAGTLALSSSGTIATSTSINIASGAYFDVTAKTASLSLAASQTLSIPSTGSNTSSYITVGSNDGVTLGSTGGITFSAYGGANGNSPTNAPLTITSASGGTLALNGAPVAITTTSALGVGTYVLIAKAGSATDISGTPGALTINGSGITSGLNSALSISAGQLILTISYPLQYRSKTTGNWNATATWDVSSDNGSTWGSASTTPTSADGTITIISPHTVTVTASVSTDQTTVDVGGTLTVSASQTLTVADGSGTDLTVAGTLTNAGTVTTTGAVTVSGTYNHTRNGGVIPTATWGTGSLMNVTGITSTACTGLNQSFHHVKWNCASQTADVPVGATVTWTGDFTMQASNTGSLYVSAGTSYSLTVSGNYTVEGGIAAISSQNSVGPGTLNVSGNLSVSGGKFYGTYSTNSTHTLSVTGNVNVTGGSFYGSSATDGSGGTWNFAGNVDLSGGTCGAYETRVINTKSSAYIDANMTGVGKTLKLPTTSMTSEYGRLANWNWNIASGSSITLLSDIYSHGSYDANNTRYYERGVYVTGTLIMDNYIIGSFSSILTTNHRNIFQVNSGATVKTKNVDGFVTASTLSGSAQTTTRTLNAGANYVYNGSSAQVTGTGLPSSLTANLTIDNTAGVTLTQATSTSGTVTLANGYLTTTTTNLLTITNTSTSAISSSNSAYISGPLKWRIANTSATYQYPVGKSGSGYYPFTIDSYASATSQSPTVEVFISDPSGTYASGCASNSEYWKVDYSANALSSPVIKLQRATASTNALVGGRSTSANGAYTSYGGTVAGSGPYTVIAASADGTSFGTALTRYYTMLWVSSVGGTATAASGSISSGSSTSISVSGYTGDIQWQESADGSTGWTNVITGSGGTSATYTTPNLSSTTYYRAVISNGPCSTATSSTATIIVTASSTITLASNTVSSADNCASTTKVPIQSFRLDVTNATGNLTNVGFTTTGTYVQADISKYQLWYHTSNDITGASQLGTDLSSSGGAGSRNFTAFSTPTLNSGSAYYFWITVDVASGATNDNTIAVNAITTSNLTSTSTKAGSDTDAGGTQTLKASPTISSHPISATICYGGTYSPSVAASGGVTLSYQWQFSTNGSTGWSSVVDNTPTNATFTNATTATLTQTGNIAQGSAYYYRCVVSSTGNGCSSVNSNAAQLTINAVPTIGTQPTTITECVGGTNALSVSASGGVTLSYQWYDNGTTNSTTGGSTVGTNAASYTPSSASTGTKYYYVVVSSTGSGCTSATSSATATTVNAQPSITTQPLDATITEGGTYSPSIVATGGVSLTYQWQYATSSGGVYSNVVDNTPTNATYTSATTTNMSLTGNVSAGTYYYKCYVTSTGSGCNAILSNAGILTITSGVTTFYFKGSGDMNNKTSWTANSDGSTGTEPTAMNTDGCTFNVFHLGSNTTPSLNGAWTLGTGSKIVVGNGTNAVNFTVPYTITGGQIDVSNNATLTITTTTNPTLGTLNSGSTIVYAGSSAQTLPASASIPRLTINNASGVSISGNSTISGTLTLTNGKLNVPSNTTLTLGASGTDITLSGGSGSSYIETASETAFIKRFVNTNTSYSFPMGEGSNYTPMTLNFTAGATTGSFITTYVKNTVAPGFVAANFQNYISRYWSVSPTGLSGTPNYTITYTYVDGDIVNDESKLVPVKVSSGTWYKPVTFTNTSAAPNITNGTAEGTGGVDVATNTLTWSGLSTFSFDMAAGDEASALPIHLLYFKAKQEAQKVRLDWATASETNNDYFTIERSQDGEHFNELFKKPGAGISTTNLYYFGYDNKPYDGVSYYRLKQTDYDGKFEYSDIESVNFTQGNAKEDIQLSIYPNPVENNIIHVKFDAKQPAGFHISLYDAVGKLIYQETINAEKGPNDHVIELPGVAAGMYQLEIRNDQLGVITRSIEF
jgi:fibronectin-binding autotransporter adhesin